MDGFVGLGAKLLHKMSLDAQLAGFNWTNSQQEQQIDIMGEVNQLAAVYSPNIYDVQWNQTQTSSCQGRWMDRGFYGDIGSLYGSGHEYLSGCNV